MTTYTVFVGGWFEDDDPEWTMLCSAGLSWEAAVALLTEELRRFDNDSCSHCRDDANEGLARLAVAKPGLFKAFVDGDDYVIFGTDDKRQPD